MNLTLTPIRFKQRAETYFANKVGVVDGDIRMTYGEFGQRANRLSNALIDMGIKRGECVAWLGYNSHELLEAYYGVVQMGAVLLPLNIRLTPAEIGFILNDSDSVAVFYNRDLQPIIDGVRNQAPGVKQYIPLEANGDGNDYETRINLPGRFHSALRHKRRRSRRALLHLRHDRKPQGRDDDPSQPLPARVAGHRRAWCR
jgi:fatty-acyl-CoA synthase